MSQEETKTRLDRATRLRDVHVRDVWQSARVSVNGGPQIQALVGKSRAGFHPGLRHDKGVDWGAAFPAKDEAKHIAQSAASEWLAARQPSRGVDR